MSAVVGKFGISAKILCDSVSQGGVRLLTFETTYPRILMSEANTHRMLSKNSASSRAIPFKKMQENLTGRPVRFGEANLGMQDKGEDFKGVVMGRTSGFGRFTAEHTPEEAWEEARKDAAFWSKAFYDAGYAKQVFNRLTEAYQMAKTVVSGTEFNNWYWLRDDDAADPSIRELARCMREAQVASTPELLKAGEYHLPYVDVLRSVDGTPPLYYLSADDIGTGGHISLEDAIKVSCARSAAVSFRNTDYGLEKCKEVYERLVGDERKHSSALEHAATPMEHVDILEHVNMPGWPETWQEGVSHADRQGQLWSGNFKGWVQHRKTVDGENYTGT